MGERILIVEDEEKLARFVELELVHEGYRVDKSTDGRDGLEKLEGGGYDRILFKSFICSILTFKKGNKMLEDF